MKKFASLIKTLDSTNKTTAKVDALARYFSNANDEDKVWTIAILSHRRPPRPVNTTLLRTWAEKKLRIRELEPTRLLRTLCVYQVNYWRF